ncbi:MAG TPA: GDP-mannose 4,6-dehydratase [Roseiflexaceae bacterium]|nr:GDP-mannose 4,6-dehydratase [Roseiflexaceae bacterium]
MRALITGINGFVGRHLAEHLLAIGGWELWGLTRQAPTANLPGHSEVQYVVADLTALDQTLAALERIQPDVIFHLAAQSNVPRSFEDPAATLTTNIIGQLHLFQTVLRLRQNPLLLIVCSNEIYGQVEPRELPLAEETALRPVNPYAVSKATQDLLAYQYHVSHGLRTIRLRPFNHIGPRQSEQFVVSAFAAQIARIEADQQAPIIHVGNLAAERDFTDVRDMVGAYVLAAQHGQVPLAYNIGSGRSVSIRWLLDTLLTFSTRDIAIEPDPARMRPADVPRVVSDSRRFREHTGWEPRIPLEQTLFDVLEYWRQRVQS